MGKAARRPLWEDVAAAGDVDQLRYPADRADLRFVPLLEVDARSTRQAKCRCAHLGDVRFELSGIAFATLPRTDHGAQPAHVGDDACHGAMVADPYLDAALDECLCDISLDVGEADHEIRFEPNDVIDPGAGEGRYFGFFFPRSCGSHGESGNAHDTIGFADGVEHFGRFLGQANNALGKGIEHG